MTSGNGSSPAGRYLIGVDTGGTFTDCVIVDGRDRVVFGKAPSMPGQLEVGVWEAIEAAAAELGRSAADVVRETTVFCHATTAGLNELYTRVGAKVALVTTRGHEDAIRIGRVYAKAAGLSDFEVTDAARLSMPAPIVDPCDIFGVEERVDAKGRVVVPLADAEIARVAKAVAASGADAVAISLLWSFRNPNHERALAEQIRTEMPNAYVSISSEIAPVLGEYERTTTTAINGYVGPTLRTYLDALRAYLAERGLPVEPLMMQSNGGVIPLAGASGRAVNLLHSGPAGGVIASAVIGRELGYKNIVTTDVGGTSFDVSLVLDGEPVLSEEPELDRFAVMAPMLDVRSIGAGGGSIASGDPRTGTLSVGPRSAGAKPGPACYGRGGTLPTVTDANLVLGRLNPDSFFSGRLRLDADAAYRAIEEHVAKPLGMSVAEAASGIVDVVDNHMADLLRRMTTERGHDARDFMIFAFGGGGPLHVGAYGAAIGAAVAVIPAQASVFSALGVASADAKHFGRISSPALMPIQADAANALFDRLVSDGNEILGDSGVELRNEYAITMRFSNQVHEVPVPIERLPLRQDEVDMLNERFLERYSARYGRGTAVAGTPIEAVTYEVVTSARTEVPPFGTASATGGATPEPTGTRPVVFGGVAEETPIYDGMRLGAGQSLEGPALIELPTTTVAVHPGQSLRVDGLGNFELLFPSTDRSPRNG
jgi:N-methylhydantoinase A